MLQKEELTRKVAERANVSLQMANEVITAVLDVLHESIANGKKVSLPRIGKIRLVEHKGRNYPNFSGGVRFVPTRPRVKFEPSPLLVGKVRKLKEFEV